VTMGACHACFRPLRDPFLRPSGEPVVRLGVQLLDDYLDFVAARSRPNTVLATAYDLAVFFRVVDKSPTEVSTADVLAFVTSQRHGTQDGRLQVVDDVVGVSSRTVARRLSIISGLFAYRTPAATLLPTRSRADCPRAGNGPVHGRECRWYVPPGRCRGS
jgi:integrase/recombinase XerD